MLRNDQLAKLMQMRKALVQNNLKDEQAEQAAYVKECIASNERMGRCPIGQDRCAVLKDIVNDDKVYEISFVVDAVANYDKVHNLQKKVVGCRAVIININGEDHMLNHAWLREVYVPEAAKFNRYRDMGSIVSLKVKVKGYDENSAKYEFAAVR